MHQSFKSFGMDIYSRSLLVLTFIWIGVLAQKINAGPVTRGRSRIPHRRGRQSIKSCQNGGTPIDSNTCVCPGGLVGKYCNHSLYVSFDTLENLTLMEGDRRVDFNAQVPGWDVKNNSAVTTNRSKQQWIDLGSPPEVCFTQRYGCINGGALSMWLKLLECPGFGGIISTQNFLSQQGFVIYCTNAALGHNMHIPSGNYLGNVSGVRITFNRWIHYVFNFIGPEDGKGFRVYHDGVLVDNITAKSKSRHRPMDRRIIIGRLAEHFLGRYNSIVIDQLLFFNKPLSEPEIAILSQTNF